MAESHEIVICKPKPSSAEIVRMTEEYFDEQGKQYDQSDHAIVKRNLFTESVNRLVASRLTENHGIRDILSIACGTGRREKEIGSLVSRGLRFVGVELSREMAKLAAMRGVRVLEGSWLEVDLQKELFDAVFILSAFGHVTSAADRLAFLRKARQSLRLGGELFFDVLNLDDQDEWGPRIRENYFEHSLADAGYDLGDVMYRKIGSEKVSFYHYFTTVEVRSLLLDSGFEITGLDYVGYGKNAGELTAQDRGAMFVCATAV